MFTRNALLGEHNVCFCTSTREKQNVLFSNLKTGLDQDCSGLYVIGEENIEQIQFEMRKFGLETDDPKKLRSVTSQQFYIPDGEFNVNRIIEQVRSNLDESMDKGFEGLYISADVSKFFDYMTKNGRVEEWLKYEKVVGRKISFPVEAICTYNVNQVKTNDHVFFNLIQAHMNTVSAKKLDFVDNENLCRCTITEEMNKILGAQATEYILGFLEKRFKMPRNQILGNIVDFNQGLEIVLGNGALSIEKHILKKLHDKIELSNMSVEVV
jgi:hypothetical protein